MSTTDESQKNNRRRFKRARFDKKIAIFHRDRFSMEQATDISEGGMLMFAGKKDIAGDRFEKGDMLEISLEVTGDRFHNVIAQVSYQFEVGDDVFVGMRFLDTNDNFAHLRNEIREYVAGASPTL